MGDKLRWVPSICLRIVGHFVLLVLKGIYHCVTYVHFSQGSQSNGFYDASGSTDWEVRARGHDKLRVLYLGDPTLDSAFPIQVNSHIGVLIGRFDKKKTGLTGLDRLLFFFSIEPSV